MKKNFIKQLRETIGFYEPTDVVWKRKDLTEEKIETKWDVTLEGGKSFEADTEFEAEVIGRLARIEELLKKK